MSCIHNTAGAMSKLPSCIGQESNRCPLDFIVLLENAEVVAKESRLTAGGNTSSAPSTAQREKAAMWL
ncbi:MAG: hypothetical protein FRX49_11326 [Trebouxia sp. A1-2]|nr:MAG: hypothetical protein FRX49_11326 [Trebouxia sp. A1-2]